MKKIMFACLLAVPLTAIAVIADTADVIKSRNAQLATLVKDSFYSDVSRLNLTPEQYTTIVKKIRNNFIVFVTRMLIVNYCLRNEIKKMLIVLYSIFKPFISVIIQDISNIFTLIYLLV